MILVTGASGFLGRHACAALAADGEPVRALVRSGQTSLPPGVELACFSGFQDDSALDAALRGVDGVIHLAGRVPGTGQRPAAAARDYAAANVDASRALVEACGRAGVRRLVFASTAKVMGERSDRPLTESMEPAPADPYALSKLRAEQVVRDVAERQGVAAAIVRLPLVYGAGVGGNMAKLLGLIWRGVPLPLGGAGNRRSLIGAGNAVAAIRAVLASPAASGETYFAADDDVLSTPELIRRIAGALGRPARLIALPPRLLRAGAAALDRTAGTGLGPAVTRLVDSLVVDATALREATGFRPPFSIDHEIQAMADWYRQTREARRVA